MPPQPPHERLSKLMDERRADLGLTWEQVADRAGIKYETIRAIRTGDSRGRTPTRRVISIALEWTPGSVDRILEGGNPETAPAGQPAAEGDDAGRQAVIAGVRAIYPGDDIAELIMTQWDKPLELRQRELKRWLAQPAGGTGDANALPSHGNEPDTMSKSPLRGD